MRLQFHLVFGSNQRNTQSSADPKIVLSSTSGHPGSSRPRVVFASLPSTHSSGSNPRVLKRRTSSEASRAVRSEPTSDVVDFTPTAVNNQTCKYRLVLHAANGTGRTTPVGTRVRASPCPSYTELRLSFNNLLSRQSAGGST